MEGRRTHQQNCAAARPLETHGRGLLEMKVLTRARCGRARAACDGPRRRLTLEETGTIPYTGKRLRQALKSYYCSPVRRRRTGDADPPGVHHSHWAATAARLTRARSFVREGGRLSGERPRIGAQPSAAAAHQKGRLRSRRLLAERRGAAPVDSARAGKRGLRASGGTIRRALASDAHRAASFRVGVCLALAMRGSLPSPRARARRSTRPRTEGRVERDGAPTGRRGAAAACRALAAARVARCGLAAGLP